VQIEADLYDRKWHQGSYFTLPGIKLQS